MPTGWDEKNGSLDLHSSSSRPVSSVTLNVPEKVEPQHVVSSPFERDWEQMDGKTASIERDAVKAISALGYLCDEASELEEVAMSALLPGILMFCPRPDSGICEGDEISEERYDELVLCTGNAMPFFQELKNFTMRCRR